MTGELEGEAVLHASARSRGHDQAPPVVPDHAGSRLELVRSHGLVAVSWKWLGELAHLRRHVIG